MELDIMTDILNILDKMDIKVFLLEQDLKLIEYKLSFGVNMTNLWTTSSLKKKYIDLLDTIFIVYNYNM